MRLMLEKKDLTIEELRSRLNRSIVAEDGANVSCDQVGRQLYHSVLEASFFCLSVSLSLLSALLSLSLSLLSLPVLSLLIHSPFFSLA
jgi:hypothetical protein